MKKFLIVLLVFLSFCTIAQAKVTKTKVDTFNNSYAWYDDYFINKLLDPIKISTTFNKVFPSGSQNYILQVFNDDVYTVDPFVQMKINDQIYSLETKPVNTSFNAYLHYAQTVFPFSGDIFNQFMKADQEITIRFSYQSIGGHFRKDYVLPIKFIKEVQQMYIDHTEK